MIVDNASFVSHADELARADAAAAALVATRRDRWYPAYHVAAEAGWINDPNGLCFYKGRYHAYFQHHPYGTEWGPMHWGHVSSADLVTWRHEPIALAPSIEADRDGCWSGSCVVGDDGLLYAFYTGHRWRTDSADASSRREVQCLATSDDGVRWEKRGVVVPGIEPLANFRDPKVWRQDDVWCMVVGQQSTQGRGQIALYTSRDLLAWDYAGVVYEHPSPEVRMLECPDLFALGDKWVLCFSAMGMRPQGYVGRNRNNTGYLVGSWRLGEPFVPEASCPDDDTAHPADFIPCDWGHNYYAPQSFLTPDGRRVQFGWMSAFQFEAAEKADGWCGQFTLPRELALGQNGRVVARPIAEVERLLADECAHGAMEVGPDEERLFADDVACGMVELVLDLAQSDAERMGIEVHRTANGNRLYVAYDAQTGCVVVERHGCRRGARGYRAVPVRPRSGLLKLQLWLDRGSVEVFVNDGEATLCELSYPGEGPRSLAIVSESGTTQVRRAAYRRMALA